MQFIDMHKTYLYHKDCSVETRKQHVELKGCNTYPFIPLALNWINSFIPFLPQHNIKKKKCHTMITTKKIMMIHFCEIEWLSFLWLLSFPLFIPLSLSNYLSLNLLQRPKWIPDKIYQNDSNHTEYAMQCKAVQNEFQINLYASKRLTEWLTNIVLGV